MNSHATFASVSEYADINNHVAPLIELEALSAITHGKAQILIKLAAHQNVKEIPAAFMFKKAGREGRFMKTHTVIEASSGGMALAMAGQARRHGLKFIACIRNDTAQGQKWALNMQGVPIIYENDLPAGMTLIEYAKEQGLQPGFLNFCQYESPENATAYEEYLAPQIYQQLCEMHLEGKPLVFCCGVGTGGTFLGTGRGLQARHPDCRAIAAILADKERVPGLRDLENLRVVKTGWQKIQYGEAIPVTRYASYLRSLELRKMGVDGGPSAGAGIAAALHYLKNREERHGVVVVCICPDSAKSYLDKYETILEGADFARIPPFGM